MEQVKHLRLGPKVELRKALNGPLVGTVVAVGKYEHYLTVGIPRVGKRPHVGRELLERSGPDERF